MIFVVAAEEFFVLFYDVALCVVEKYWLSGMARKESRFLSTG